MGRVHEHSHNIFVVECAGTGAQASPRMRNRAVIPGRTVRYCGRELGRGSQPVLKGQAFHRASNATLIKRLLR